MLFMSKERLKILETFWEQHESGLNVKQFLQLMSENISCADDDERYELMYGCMQLFNEVDINGDGNMEWSEFMQYIIDAVDGNNIRGGEGKETVAEQLEAIKSLKYKRF